MVWVSLRARRDAAIVAVAARLAMYAIPLRIGSPCSMCMRPALAERIQSDRCWSRRCRDQLARLASWGPALLPRAARIPHRAARWIQPHAPRPAAAGRGAEQMCIAAGCCRSLPVLGCCWPPLHVSFDRLLYPGGWRLQVLAPTFMVLELHRLRNLRPPPPAWTLLPEWLGLCASGQECTLHHDSGPAVT